MKTLIKTTVEEIVFNAEKGRIHTEYTLSYNKARHTKAINIVDVPMEDMVALHEMLGDIIEKKGGAS